VSELRRHFGEVRAVDGVSFAVRRGEVLSIIGPNGSGKTTTIQAILGFIKPSAGTIRINGEPLVPATFERLVYIPETSALYGAMTIAEHIAMQRQAFRSFDRDRATSLLEFFALDPKRRIRSLSKGQRNAAALVLAFARRPRIAILDEPTDGLDPVFQRAVLDLLIDAAGGGSAILLSSHQIGLVERAADRVVVLQRGRLRIADDVDTLKTRRRSITAVFRDEIPPTNGLASLPGVVSLDRTGSMLNVGIDGDPAPVLAHLEALAPLDLRVAALDLEEIFMQTVRPEGAGGGLPS
jgi:ABC-2 type transport system ATP-binding protein